MMIIRKKTIIMCAFLELLFAYLYNDSCEDLDDTSRVYNPQGFLLPVRQPS